MQSLSSNSRQQYLRQQYPPPLLGLPLCRGQSIYSYMCIYIYIYMLVALIAQWLWCQPHEAEVLSSTLTTST